MISRGLTNANVLNISTSHCEPEALHRVVYMAKGAAISSPPNPPPLRGRVGVGGIKEEVPEEQRKRIDHLFFGHSHGQVLSRAPFLVDYYLLLNGLLFNFFFFPQSEENILQAHYLFLQFRENLL